MLGWRRSAGIVLMLLVSAQVAAVNDDNRLGREDSREGRSGSEVVHDKGRQSADSERSQDKQCMKVCNEWTRDCIVDKQGDRQCWRSCKQVGEHCF